MLGRLEGQTSQIVDMATEVGMSEARALHWMADFWHQTVLPTLCEYIRVPNQSPGFDPEWQHNGLLDEAVQLVADWVRRQNVPDLAVEVCRMPGRSPLLLVEYPGSREGTVLLYGHLDKQPPFEGWDPDLGPYVPVLRGDRLYGRGSADDGYAVFAIVAALAWMQEDKRTRPRCVALIETSEESGSSDLPAYVEALRARIGEPGLVVALDSGCGDYDRLWVTVSLRGLVNGILSVAVLREGMHSGAGSGVVPSSFRIARSLLDRLEDARSGGITVPELTAAIPPLQRQEAERAATVLGPRLLDGIPFLPGVRPVTDDVVELLLNRTWRPQLEITGAAGFPSPAHAGNVLRPRSELKLSLRLPPTVNAHAAAAAVKRTLEENPPYHARVSFTCSEAATGWVAPSLTPELATCLRNASHAYFGADPCFMGEGGTIPFMAMLGKMFPAAQFLVTGVLGPNSNAHGPNEFLHLPTAQKLSCVLADVLHHWACRRIELASDDAFRS